MAKDLKLNGTFDLELDASGDVAVVEDSAAVRQRLSMKLQTFKGTWFLDPEFGVDYYASVLGHARNDAVLNAVFVPAVTETPGILGLKEPIDYKFTPTTRILSVEFTALLDSGEELALAFAPGA